MLLSWRKYAKLYCMIVVGILLPKLGPLFTSQISGSYSTVCYSEFLFVLETFVTFTGALYSTTTTLMLEVNSGIFTWVHSGFWFLLILTCHAAV